MVVNLCPFPAPAQRRHDHPPSSPLAPLPVSVPNLRFYCHYI